MLKDFIFTGKTIDEAIQSGCAELGIERDDVSVEVLETPSRSFLGLKVTPAKVKLSMEFPDEPKAKEKPRFEAPRPQQQPQQQPKPQQSQQQQPRQAVPQPQQRPFTPQPQQHAPVSPQQPKQEIRRDPVRTEPPREVNRPQPPKQEQRPSPVQQAPSKPRVAVSDEDLTTAGKNVSGFLGEVMGILDIGAAVDLKVEEGALNVGLTGNNMGIIIGRRGETLDSLQYLASLVANKGHEEYIKVNLDTENYRQKREASLTTLAQKVAAKVEKNQKSVTLEPMNPYERRIIHSVLQENSKVTTASVGMEPNRKVVVHPAGMQPNRPPQSRYHKNRRPYHKPQQQPAEPQQ